MMRPGSSTAYYHERVAPGARARLERMNAAAATSRASVAAAAELREVAALKKSVRPVALSTLL